MRALNLEKKIDKNRWRSGKGLKRLFEYYTIPIKDDEKAVKVDEKKVCGMSSVWFHRFHLSRIEDVRGR